jgi:hypothetical protein
MMRRARRPYTKCEFRHGWPPQGQAILQQPRRSSLALARDQTEERNQALMIARYCPHD